MCLELHITGEQKPFLRVKYKFTLERYQFQLAEFDCIVCDNCQFGKLML